MIIRERCSYCCDKIYKTNEDFLAHWNRCPVRIKYGYIDLSEAHEDLGGHS